MSVQSFEELCSRLRDSLLRMDTNMRTAITPEERLALALRYLASGCSFNALHLYYRIGKSTVASIVRDVCVALWMTMKDICLPEPTKETWLSIAEIFEKQANFPHCVGVGAVDGKHIRIIKPTRSASMFFNYKKFFSIVLMAVAGANYNFVAIDVGAYGKSGDPTVFKDSAFGKKFQRKQLNIPEPATLTADDNGLLMPYTFIGDEAFSLSENMTTPFANKGLTEKKRIFNYRLSRARRFVECSFGILANKWRIFHRPIDVDPDFADEIIKAGVILHNFVRARDGYRFEDTLAIPCIIEEVEGVRSRATSSAKDIRNYFADYFTSPEGLVAWQYDKI